jgi:hypothetical protein
MDGLTITFLLGIVMIWGIYFFIKIYEKKHKHD